MTAPEIQWTAEQQLLLDHKDGSAFVMAGPGSGKTSVLAERVRRITSSDPDVKVLAVTFGRKAKADLERKLSGIPEGQAEVATFHGYAKRLLEAQCGEIYIESKLTSVVADARMNYEAALLSASLELERNAPQDLFATFASFWNAYTSRLKDVPLVPSAWIDQFNVDDPDFYVCALTKFMEMRLKTGVFALDELMSAALYCLTTKEAIRKEFLTRYTEILVDELQDTNNIQWNLVYALADKTRCIGFGDRRQGIYAFSGANRENAMSFHKFFPNAAEYELTINHRARPALVAFANFLLSRMNEPPINPRNRDDMGDAVFTVKAPVSQNLKRYASSEQYQDAIVRTGASVVSRLLRQGTPQEEIMVIARTNGTVSLFADAMGSKGIATQVLDANAAWDQESLRLATVHGAKGLESNVVVLLGADSRGFTTYHCQGNKEALGELQRCFFVAATRAKDALLLIQGEGKGIGTPFDWPMVGARTVSVDNLPSMDFQALQIVATST